MLVNKPLKIGLWNLENFFVENSRAIAKNSFNRPKSADLRQQIGTIMQQMDADIWCLCEIGGEEALDWINQQLLRQQFTPVFPMQTSKRGIDVGILVKNDLVPTMQKTEHLPLSLKPNSGEHQNENEYWMRGQRAILEVRFTIRKQSFTLLHVHLKSPVTEIGKDPNGKHKRREELQFLQHLIGQLTNSRPHDHFIITGDFNCALSDKDLLNFRQSCKLQNYLEATTQSPKDQWSLAARTYSMLPVPLLIDYIFLSEKLLPLVDGEQSGIWSLRNKDQQILTLPAFAHFRHTLPSDHRPQILQLNLHH